MRIKTKEYYLIMENYLILILTGLFSFIIHYIYLYRLNKYLSTNYPAVWEKLCKIPIIPNNLILYRKEPSIGFNYFSVMKFVFSKKLSDDGRVVKSKKPVKTFGF